VNKPLKFNIKNTQLAEALQLNTSKLKKKLGSSTDKKVESKGKPKKPKLLQQQLVESTPTVANEEQAPVFVELPKEKKPVEATKAKTEQKLVKKPPLFSKPDEAPQRPKKVGFKNLRDIKPTYRQFDSRSRAGLNVGEEERWRKKRRTGRKKSTLEQLVIRPKHLTIHLPITVKDLAAEMKIKASELIAKLFMHGVTHTINDYLEDDVTVQLLGTDFDCEITIDTSEKQRLQITDKTIEEEIAQTDSKDVQKRPPIVTFMGHVDHGKTSLIDAIRSSNRAAQEAGDITQHIGAFLCETAHGKITILDTPGHEAFSAMRARGAHVTDIIVLVVAGDEGIKEQTVEAIKHAKEAKVTLLVAINKMDKPAFNVDEVYRQLAENEIMVEAWGGDIVTVNCSAKSNEGIKELVELIGLQSQILELKANPSARARGVVLESQMHKGLGSVATLLVLNGTLHLKDAVVFDDFHGRIKTIQDEYGKQIKSAPPAFPGKVTGLSGSPLAGSEFIVVANEKEAKQIALGRKKSAAFHLLQRRSAPPEVLEETKEAKKVLHLILRADVQGSLEALIEALHNIKSDKAEVHIIQSNIGEIAESDVSLAIASSATIIGFHTNVGAHAEPMIKAAKVPIFLYDIIYHVVDQVKELMRSLLDKIPQENIRGLAKVQAIFKSSQLGLIAGCIIEEGLVHRKHKARLKRNDEVIWEGNILSIKHLKDEIKEAKKGFECGLLLQGFNKFELGDLIETYEIEYLEPTL